jgi:hypothetical protein
MHEIQSGQILFDEDEAPYVEPLVSLSSHSFWSGTVKWKVVSFDREAR